MSDACDEVWTCRIRLGPELAKKGEYVDYDLTMTLNEMLHMTTYLKLETRIMNIIQQLYSMAFLQDMENDRLVNIVNDRLNRFKNTSVVASEKIINLQRINPEDVDNNIVISAGDLTCVKMVFDGHLTDNLRYHAKASLAGHYLSFLFELYITSMVDKNGYKSYSNFFQDCFKMKKFEEMHKSLMVEDLRVTPILKAMLMLLISETFEPFSIYNCGVRITQGSDLNEFNCCRYNITIKSQPVKPTYQYFNNCMVDGIVRYETITHAHLKRKFTEPLVKDLVEKCFEYFKIYSSEIIKKKDKKKLNDDDVEMDDMSNNHRKDTKVAPTRILGLTREHMECFCVFVWGSYIYMNNFL